MARHSPLALQAAKGGGLRQSGRRCHCRQGWPRSANCSRCSRPRKTGEKASTPSYRNVLPTLKDANCEFILSHVEQGVMALTLNRPERLNSFLTM